MESTVSLNAKAIDFNQATAHLKDATVNIRVCKNMKMWEGAVEEAEKMKGWHLISDTELTRMYYAGVKEVREALSKGPVFTRHVRISAEQESGLEPASNKVQPLHVRAVITGPNKILEDGTWVPVTYDNKPWNAYPDQERKSMIESMFKRLQSNERLWDRGETGILVARYNKSMPLRHLDYKERRAGHVSALEFYTVSENAECTPIWVEDKPKRIDQQTLDQQIYDQGTEKLLHVG